MIPLRHLKIGYRPVKKIILLLAAAFLLFFPRHGTARVTDIQLIVHEVKCMEDEKIVIHYGIINTRNADRPKVSLCFKLMKEGMPVAGRELIVLIPAKADGSQMYETSITLPCEKQNYKLRSTFFYNVKRYKIEEWFKGCPGTWESEGHDELVHVDYE